MSPGNGIEICPLDFMKRFRHCWQNLLAASEFDIRIRLEALS
jgi:hypothetical protein